MEATKGKLYLVPTVLSEEAEFTIPAYVIDIVKNISIYAVENIRTTRRYLRKIGFDKNFDTQVHFTEILKNTKTDYKPLLDKLIKGENAGLISEAGCVGIADPGMELIAMAHKLDIEVVPLVGPSSILLALIGSGLNGQGFTFHGYLPIEKSDKIKKLNEMQNLAHKSKFTQIFMETPFRNNAMLEDIISHCDGNLMLTIATDLTGKQQSIKTKKLSDWKKATPDIHKIPTVFCINYIEAK
jgi:16S rRNA (cytidine1402-2'-O)-methyltransferase